MPSRETDKTGWLLAGAFALILAALLGAGLIGSARIDDIRSVEADRRATINAKRELLSHMQTLSRERAISLTLASKIQDPFERDDEFMRFTGLGARFADARDGYIDLGVTDEEMRLFELQGRAAAAAKQSHEAMFQLMMDNQDDKAADWLTTISIPQQGRVYAALAGIDNYLTRQEVSSADEMAQRYSDAYAMLAALFLGTTLLVGGGVGAYVVRRITGIQYQLASEKERFQRAVRGSNDGIWEYDFTTNTTYLSDRWMVFLGYSADTQGLTLEDWCARVHAQDLPILRDAARRLTDDEIDSVDESIRLCRSNGEYLWCRMRGSISRDAAGKPLRATGSLTDISEQKKQELAVKHRARILAEQQEALLRFSHIDCRITGELTLALRQVTTEAAQVSGVPKVSIWFYDVTLDGLICMDRYVLEEDVHEDGWIIQESEHPELISSIKHDPVIVIQGGARADRERVLGVLYQKNFEFESAEAMIISPVRSGGELLGALVFESNERRREWLREEITFASSVGDMVSLAIESCRRHKAESQLQEAMGRLEERVAQRTQELAEKNRDLDIALEQAQDASRSKSEFLANMSHEIRTPMNGVLGMLNLLRDSELSPYQQDLAETAYGSGEALLRLLNDILDLSKIEAGKLDIEETDFDLREKLESVVGLLAARAHEKGLEIHSLMPPEMPEWVRGDPTRLRQVLTNLLGNAIKFTERGEVGVSVSLLAEEAGEMHLRFEIQDTGIGIPRQAQAKIFETFSQADGSTTRRFGGSGLGLTICKHLCELMGGEIGVVSNQGQGSCFWFTVKLKQARSVPPRSVPPETLRNVSTLIVDDNTTNRLVLHHYLKSWGMQSAEAESAAEALRMLRSSPKRFDLVLSDMMMPEMNGEQFARTVRADDTLHQPRMVLLTSMSFSGCTADSRPAMFDACLPKPVRQSLLFNTLLSLFGEQNVVEQKVVPTSTEPSERNERLLVVEDHPVNQKVALGLLRKFGFAAETANNGVEALHAVQAGQFDLIFMDCQMPQMDGYESTRRMREEGIDVPIIAMTANAMHGDRERCIKAGMDDYLSKPLKPDAIEEMLMRYLPTPSLAVKEAPSQTREPPEPTVNNDVAPALVDHETVEMLRTALGDDLEALWDEYIQTSASELDELESLIDTGDYQGAERLAHRLKGSSGNIGLGAISTACRELELAFKENAEPDHCRDGLRRLRSVTQQTLRAREEGCLVSGNETPVL